MPIDAPELEKHCRPHLKTTKKSYRVDEIYIKVKGKTGISTVRWTPAARRIDFL
jgi:transposase-like protein